MARSFLSTNTLAALAVLTFGAASACSSSSTGLAPGGSADTGTTPGTDTGPSSTDVGAPVDDGAVADCSELPADRPAGSTCLRHATGKVVDEAGKPVPNLSVTVCGRVCYFGHTGDDGAFDVHVGHYIVVDRFNAVVHGVIDHASSDRPLPAVGADGTVVFDRPVPAPTFDKIGTALPDPGVGGTVSAGEVTLVIPAGTELGLDPDVIEAGAAGRTFRSYRWKDSTLPTFATGSNVAALWALGPFDTQSCKKVPCNGVVDTIKMGVSVANPSAATLPAGTAVEFVSLAVDLFSKPFNAGQMVVVATGKVSADGKSIDSDAGQGIATLSWLGVRKK
ncbi:MAG: hypothetical protein NVSMB47_06420 [Polyangiales bacterium]